MNAASETLEKEPGGRELTALLEFLKGSRGFDFTGYKRAGLQRRIDKRMDQVGVEGYGQYVDHLETNPVEFGHLFNTILINVTSFFRDPETWHFLGQELVPALIQQRPDDAPLRVWVPGCASGEEAYTVAMVLAEVLGTHTFQERVKIYGTDVDDEALADARNGSYTEKDLEAVPAELHDRYFEHAGGRFAFRKELRRSVIFGRNDLMTDAPISRIDLLLCRNTLMYFNSEAQQAVLARFHFALNPDGYLCLGRSEMLTNSHGVFTALDLKRRVFKKIQSTNLRDRLTAVARADDTQTAPELNVRIRHGAFDQAPLAQLVVDVDGVLVLANRQARAFFELHPDDTGRPLKDLSVAYKPIELLDAIEATRSEKGVVDLGPADWKSPGADDCHLEVRVAPLAAPGGELLGASVSYFDVTAYSRLQNQLERSRRDLETAYEELQSTVEELETTNEELQSTNEELETTNEELQSTNEELETTNEELQSTNEELETINDELTLRTDELEQVTAFMDSILTSLGLTVVVLDRDQSVQVWNAGAEDLWGLRPERAEGQHFLGLDIGLPVEKLKPMIGECLSGRSEREEMTLQSLDRRGHEIDCRVTCVSLRDQRDETTGVILVMNASRREAPSD